MSNTKNLVAAIWALCMAWGRGQGWLRQWHARANHAPVRARDRRQARAGFGPFGMPSTRCQMLFGMRLAACGALVWTFGRLVFAAKKHADAQWLHTAIFCATLSTGTTLRG